MLTQVLLQDGPKWTEGFTTTFTGDFRATENLTLSLNVIFNAYNTRFYNRQVTMQASANNTGATHGPTAGGGGRRAFIWHHAHEHGGVTPGVYGGGNGLKFTNTITIGPSRVRWKDVVIDGACQIPIRATTTTISRPAPWLTRR